MTQSPIEVLKAFYDAERRYMQSGGPTAGANFDEMASTLDPDVLLHQSPDLPWGGTYVGHSGFREWSAKMSDCFDYLDVQCAEFFEKDDTIVILCRLVTRSRVHGDEIDNPMAQVVTVRGGKIIEFRPYYWNVPKYVAAAT